MKLGKSEQNEVANILGVDGSEAVLELIEDERNVESFLASFDKESQNKLAKNIFDFMDTHHVALDPQEQGQPKVAQRIRGLPEGIVLLDGATGTELDRRGVDCSLPLWSARAMLEAPDVLKDVHKVYLEVGAQVIVTNTFRTHQRSMAKAGIGEEAEELTKQACEIAMAARDEINPDALVLGSVAPLEDCYQPELTPDTETCLKEHRLIIGQMVDAGVDMILIETIPSAREGLASAQIAEELAPGRWGIAFCMKKSDKPGIIMDGTLIADILPRLSKASFIGVNCISAHFIEAEVKHLRSLLPPSMRIIAYGNAGYVDDAKGWTNTDAVDPKIFAKYVQTWIDAGASLVGSCCGTTPETIDAIKKHCFDDKQEEEIEVADNSTPTSITQTTPIKKAEPVQIDKIPEKFKIKENEARKFNIGLQ